MSNSEVVRNLGLVDAQSDIDIIRGNITVYDPRAAYAAAAGEWGIFDPLWTTEIQWDRIDIPPGTSFSGIGDRPPELDTADFFTSIDQLLPLGTRFRTDYVTDYLFNPDHPPSLDPNPQYFSYVQFGLTQPLMQGLGVNVTMAPIRIACAEAERTDWQFKQEVLALVRSVETAYWTLYAEQQNLRALDETLPLFREIVRVREEQARGAAGTETEVARATSEMLLYAQRRLDTLSRIAEQQLVLRNLMGLPTHDGRYLALVALPMTIPPFESVGDAIVTAVNMRPDVLRQRIAVYVAQQERILARDSFRPRFDFDAFWRINGLGEDLGESLDVIGDNDFHDWHLGLRFQVPLGRRRGRANVRSAELIIQRERALLEQTAHQASFEVADAYRRIIWLHQQYRVSSERVAALTRWREGAQAQFENPPPGVSTVIALELYLNNLRDFAEASIKSNAILADFNSALARLEEVKGTLLETRLIEVAGDDTKSMPEDLPTPTIQLPEWMAPPPAELKGPVAPPEPGTSTQSLPPIAAAPAAPGPALVNPETAGLPLAVPTDSATNVREPAVASPSTSTSVQADTAPAEKPATRSAEIRQPKSITTHQSHPPRGAEAIADNFAKVAPQPGLTPPRQAARPQLRARSAPAEVTPHSDPAYAKLFENPSTKPLNSPSIESTAPIATEDVHISQTPNSPETADVPELTPAPLVNPEEFIVEDRPQLSTVERPPLPTRVRGALENFMSEARPERSTLDVKMPAELPATPEPLPVRNADRPAAPVREPQPMRPLLDEVELYAFRLKPSRPKPKPLAQPQIIVSDLSTAPQNPTFGAHHDPAPQLVNPEKIHSEFSITDRLSQSESKPDRTVTDSHDDFTLIDPEAQRLAWSRNASASPKPSAQAPMINPAASDPRGLFYVSDLESTEHSQRPTARGLVNPEAFRPVRPVQRGVGRSLSYPTSIGSVGAKRPQHPEKSQQQQPAALVNPAGFVVTDMLPSEASD